MAAPFATLNKAQSVATPGQIIYLRGGTYALSSTIRITNSGTAGNPTNSSLIPARHRISTSAASRMAQPIVAFCFYERELLDGQGARSRLRGRQRYQVEGSHHRFEQCVLHHNGDTGIQIGFGHDDVNPGGQLAAFIEVVNCDSYLNYDSDSNGGDADGFAAKMHCGQGIVFTGCRAWENSDDGWDLFETDYSIVISNCWTWKSGVGRTAAATASNSAAMARVAIRRGRIRLGIAWPLVTR